MRYYIVFAFIMISNSYASTDDLEVYLNNLQQRKVATMAPVLPSYTPKPNNYRPLHSNNLFSDTRLTTNEADLFDSFSLEQLQMVGYLNYENTDYVFLRTPHETLKFKLGDKIKDGIITLITAESVQINQTELEGDTSYTRKIILKLDQGQTNNRPELPKLSK